MTKTIIAFLAAISATGCATSAQIKSLQARVARAEWESAYLRQQLAARPAPMRIGQRPPVRLPEAQPLDPYRAVPAAPPAPPARRTTTVAAPLTTLAERNPGGFQCFLDRDPGVGGGHWLRVDNHYADYNNPSRNHWISLTIDSQPVVVIGPAGPLWVSMMATPAVSVLPPGASCFIPMPERRKPNGDIRTYTLRAKAYVAETNSFGSRTVLSGTPDGFFPNNGDTEWKSRFTLEPGPSTFTLEPYHFN